MYSGRDALFTVEQAIGRVRADETQLDATLRSAIEEAARLRREEAEGFRVLARIKLDAMVRDRVVEHLDANERRALAMIDSHRQALEENARKREAAQARLTQAEQAKHQKDEALAEALQELDTKRAGTADRIKTDPAWLAAKAEVDEAQRVAEAADKKAKQAEDDLAEKGQPYESDPLFMYLWERRHGTAEDRSGPLVRFFDRKVARLIDYQAARPNYAMLREIPLRLREHAKARAAEVDAARARLAELEHNALIADGAGPLEERANVARKAAFEAEQAVQTITAEIHQLDVERERIVGAGDEAAYGGAIELLAQSLAREDMRQLYAEALRTPTPADEQALDAIARAREQLQRADQEVAQIRSEIRELAQRRTELEGARDRARSQGYDSPLGGFAGAAAGAIIGQVIGAILSGSARGADLDRVFRDNYQWREPQAPPDFGGGVWGKPSGPMDDWGPPVSGKPMGGPWGGGSPWGKPSGDWGGGKGGGFDEPSGGGWRTKDGF